MLSFCSSDMTSVGSGTKAASGGGGASAGVVGGRSASSSRLSVASTCCSPASSDPASSAAMCSLPTSSLDAVRLLLAGEVVVVRFNRGRCSRHRR